MPISFSYQISSFKIKKKKQVSDWILLVAYLQNKGIEKIEYIFCDDDYLLQLNKKYLSHQTLTDIITFNYNKQKESIVAEIYISIERVKENAVNFKISFEEELHRVIIHGLLHCFGYNDKKNAEQKRMRRKEDEYLKLLTSLDQQTGKKN